MRTTVVASLAAFALAVVGALQIVPTPASAAPEENPWLGQRVMNMAHSGGEDEAPMNTMYAFERSLAIGADMLELDVQLTADGRLAVIHDATVDDTTDHTGPVDSYTMDELRAMDAAHWFVPGRSTVHDDPDAQYPLRGARYGDVDVEGHQPSDFGVPSLSDVLTRFPDVPVNIEIKGTGTEASYLATARELADRLGDTGRTDIIVGSFSDAALAEFHRLAPGIPMSAGQDAMIAYYLSDTPLPEGVVALQVPITYSGIRVVTRSFVDRAHRDGYAVHAWFSGSAPDDAETYSNIIDTCVDGLMPAKPSVLEEVLQERGIERPSPGGTEPRPECAIEQDPEPTEPDPTLTTEPGPSPTTTPTDEPTSPTATPTTEPTGPTPTATTEPTMPTTPTRSSGPAEPTTSAAGDRPPSPGSDGEPERPAIVQTDGWTALPG